VFEGVVGTSTMTENKETIYKTIAVLKKWRKEDLNKSEGYKTMENNWNG